MTERYRRGDLGYEEARRQAVTIAELPERYPDVIVRPTSAEEVRAALAEANRDGLKVGIRSGGHSFAASFLRDGGLLLDLSRLDGCEIDLQARSAWVQPAVTGGVLNRKLHAHGLFFPVGHCAGVGLGGFLLQGGFGWNSRVSGPAAASVRALEVVTADGQLVRCDERENADLFWAARGAGAGFFGVVTRFEVALQKLPGAIMTRGDVYAAESLPEVLAWARELQPSLPRELELTIFVSRGLFDLDDAPLLLVAGDALMETEAEARNALDLLASCPGEPLHRLPAATVPFEELLARTELFFPPRRRAAADNMWTDASAGALAEPLLAIARDLPAKPSHMMLMFWGPPRPLPEMAFSMEADLYVALYAISDGGEAAERNRAWVTERMRELEPFAVGIQLADENLGARPFRFMAEANLARLEQIRRERDPNGVFHTYMGVPA